MANNTTIETLKIKVVYELGGKNPAASLSNIAQALNKLQEISKSFNMKRATNELTNFSVSTNARLKTTQKILNDVARDLRTIQSFSKLKLNFKFTRNTAKTLESYTSNLANKLQTEKSSVGGGTNITGVANAAGNTSSIPKSTKAIKDAKKAVDALNKSGVESAKTFANLWKSIGRIAFYRIIRTIIKLIGDAFKSGIELLKSSDGVANSINQLKATWKQVSNTVASIIAPLLQTLAPIIMQLTQVLQPTLNFLAKLVAIISGQQEYMVAKNVSEATIAMEELNRTLLSFDEINKASAEQSSTTDLSVYFDTEQLNGFESIVADGFKALWDAISLIINALGDIPIIVERLTSILNTATGNNVLLKTPMSGFWLNLLSVVMKTAEYLLGKLVDSLATALENTTAKSFMGQVAKTALDAGYWMRDILGFASGGMVNNASLFYANENGVPEYIGQIGNHTAVANNDQIIEGIKQGVLEAMLMANKDKEITIQIYNDNMITAERLVKAGDVYNKRSGRNVFSFANS